jgi:hypothetical protein
MEDQIRELEKIKEQLQAIELRIRGLEYGVESRPGEIVPPLNLNEQDEINYNGDELESRIGRFGLAWLGNIVLLVGIAFMTQYLFTLGYPFLSVLFGYLSALSIFFLALHLRSTNGHLAFMFNMNAQILLFYITFRLHFFSSSPLIKSESLSLLLLLSVISFQIYLAIKNKSQTYAAIAIMMAFITAIAGDSTHFTLSLLILISVSAVYFFGKFNWQTLLVVSVFLTYICYILWLWGNPLMGHPAKMSIEINSGIIYLFALGACFSSVLLFREKDGSSDDVLHVAATVNGIFFSLLLFFLAARFLSEDYVILFSVVTICCILYSIYLHKKLNWNFASAFYALYGFMAMSVVFFGLRGFPQAYLLLSVQSLVVVSMALWFKNRLIVVMNSLLFLSILLFYMISSESVNGVNFSFALVALISARVINWKKSRLKIETDLIRNLYMIEGFFMVLYAIINLVPKHFVSISWTMAALLYFILSILLKNVKYRYMSLATVICAAFYLFIVDLAGIQLIFRVMALLFLAVISLGISIYYTNRMKKPES